MENYKNKGAACFIIENNKILLTERKGGSYTGYWEVPAGHKKETESFEQAIKREVKEETNLDIETIEEIGVNIDDKNMFESHMFLARIVGGELINTAPHENSKLEFVDLKNLPEKLGSSTIKGLEILSQRGLVDL